MARIIKAIIFYPNLVFVKPARYDKLIFSLNLSLVKFVSCVEDFKQQMLIFISNMPGILSCKMLILVL